MSCSAPAPAPDFSLKTRDVPVGTGVQTHYYHWGTPARDDTPAGFRFPLVIYLHGWGPSNNPGDLRDGFPYAPQPLVELTTSADHPAFVYVPVCPPPYKTRNEPPAPDGGEWNSEAAQTMVVQTIEALKAEYPIDPDRIYLVGFSMGGAGTWFIGARYHRETGSRFAAVSRGSGWYLDEMDGREDLHKALSLTPTWIHVGETEGRGFDTAWDTYRYFEAHFARSPGSRSTRTVGQGLVADPPADTVDGRETPLAAELLSLTLDTGAELRLSVYQGRGHEDLMYRNADFLGWLFDQRLNSLEKDRRP